MPATPHHYVSRSARDPLSLHGEIDSLSRRPLVDDPQIIGQMKAEVYGTASGIPNGLTVGSGVTRHSI